MGSHHHREREQLSHLRTGSLIDGDDDEVGPAADWQDSSSSGEPSPQPRARPGAITPLGIRHDKSKGPLGLQTAASTLQEMDMALIRLRSWQSSHQSHMAVLRSREEREVHQLEEEHRQLQLQTKEVGLDTPLVDANTHGFAESSAHADPHDRSARAPPPTGWMPSPSRTHDPAARPQTASPQVGRFGKGKSCSFDGNEDIPDRPSTSHGIGAGKQSAALLSRPLVPDELHLLRESMTLTFPSGETHELPHPAFAEAEREGADEHAGVGRGDQLLAQLEAELEELDREAEANELVTWESDLQEVLSRIDTLQIGYQATARRTGA